MDDFEDIQRGRRQLYQAFVGITGVKGNESATFAVLDNKENTTTSATKSTIAPKADHMEEDKSTALLSPTKSPNDSLRKVANRHEHAHMEGDKFIQSLPPIKSLPVSLYKSENRHDDANLPVGRSSRLSVVNNVQHRKPKILLVTGSQNVPCQTAEGNHYLLKSIQNKMDYCRVHGIEMVHKMSLLDPEMPGFRAKSLIIRELMLSEPQLEWIWWMDSDAIFTDMSRELPLERFVGYNLVIQTGDERMQRKGKRQLTGGTTGGSFMMRNCEWSLDLLEAWARKAEEESSKSGDQFELVENMMMEQPSKVLLESRGQSKDDVNADNLYWEVRANRFENQNEKQYNHQPQHTMMGDRLYNQEKMKWPLVTHFLGCKPCSRAPSKATRRCMTQMQQAFKVADTQALTLISSSIHHLPSLHQSLKHDLSSSSPSNITPI